MKNIFKQKNNFLKNSYIIKALSVLILLSFVFGFAYNQSKEILAVEEGIEEEEKGRLLCGKEIPVGEAMEKTGELLKAIIEEIEKIKINSLNLIESHKEMEELAKRCNLDNCIPSCEEVPIYDDYGNLIGHECIPQPCEGDPCPEKEKIKELFAEITNLNNEIQESKDKIHKLIYERVEPLCIKENEDIRTPVERIRCANPLCWELTRESLLFLSPEGLLEKIGLCPSITIQEAIERKLNLSRSEFNKCYIPLDDWEKVVKGEKEGKILFNCDIVMDQNLPRETKTITAEGVPVCTSLHNWFCCH